MLDSFPAGGRQRCQTRVLLVEDKDARPRCFWLKTKDATLGCFQWKTNMLDPGASGGRQICQTHGYKLLTISLFYIYICIYRIHSNKRSALINLATILWLCKSEAVSAPQARKPRSFTTLPQRPMCAYIIRLGVPSYPRLHVHVLI